MAIRAAQAQVMVDPARPLMQEPVERQRVAVAVERMENVEPAGGRSVERAALEAELTFERFRAADLVADDIPVEHRFARTGHRKGAPLRVGDVLRAAARAREGELHHGEADQHDDQHQAADEARRSEIIGEITKRGRSRRDDPDGQEIPGGNQHHRAVGPARGQTENEKQADAGDGGDRDAGDAGRHRRVEDGEGDHRRHQDEPRHREMQVAHVPAAQVEVGEQEHDQGRRDGRLDACAPDPLGRVLEAEHFSPEAEIDADISEHRPGERGGGGKDHRPAHHEHDGQEQGEKTSDADQNALVEGEAGRLVLEGVRLPEIELRQIGRAQLGDVGHGRSRIERQAEHVGLWVVLALGRLALARGDGRDARGAEIGPDHAGADQPKVRRHDEAGQLLVGVVREGEDDPRGLRAGFESADLDAPDDAVRSGSGRDLNPIALGAVALDRSGEIDRVGIGRNPDRPNRQRRRRAGEGEAEQENEANEEAQRSAGRRAAAGPRGGNGAKRGRPGGVQINSRQIRTPPSAARRRRSRADRTACGRATRRRS